MDSHVGEGGDNLELGGQLGALFKLEIANGTGQSQVAVDTAEVDEAAGSNDTRLLAYG